MSPKSGNRDYQNKALTVSEKVSAYALTLKLRSMRSLFGICNMGESQAKATVEKAVHGQRTMHSNDKQSTKP